MVEESKSLQGLFIAELNKQHFYFLIITENIYHLNFIKTRILQNKVLNEAGIYTYTWISDVSVWH